MRKTKDEYELSGLYNATAADRSLSEADKQSPTKILKSHLFTGPRQLISGLSHSMNNY